MVYTCEACNVEMDNKSNFNRHLKSERHIEKLKKVKIIEREKRKRIKCEFCESLFSTVYSLKRHQTTTCTYLTIADEIVDFGIKEITKENKSKISEDTIELLKTKIQYKIMRERMKEKDKIYTDKIEENKKLLDEYKTRQKLDEKLIEHAENLTHGAVSAMKYVMMKFNNAPPLKQLDNETILNLLEHETYNGRIIGKIKNKSKVQYLVDLTKLDKLHSHLGILILSSIKKEDKSLQSLWNTDVSRLTYLIRTDSNNKYIWRTDKNGSEIKEMIINPIINKISDIIKAYDESINGIFTHLSTNEKDKYADNSIYTLQIKDSIVNGKLCTDIMKFISPKLFLVKD